MDMLSISSLFVERIANIMKKSINFDEPPSSINAQERPLAAVIDRPNANA